MAQRRRHAPQTTGTGVVNVETPPAGSVLRNTAFVRLWSAQVVSQTAQNGLMLTLLVLVTERTGSSVNGSLLVLAFSLPSVLWSIPAGVLVDRWHKRTVMILANVVRALMALAFIGLEGWVPALLVGTLVFSSASQFFTPAESSTIPSLVPRAQLISANALFQLTLTGSQFMGLVVLAPALLKLGGPQLYFAMMVGLYSIATFLIASLPRGFEPELSREPLTASRLLGSVAGDVRDALRVISADRLSLLALAQLTVSSSLAMLFGLLVPRFVHDVLDIAPDNAVFVFAPVALGAVLGLRMVAWFTNRFPKQTVVTFGLIGVAASLLALSSVEAIGSAVEQAGARQFVEHLGREQPRFATMTLSVLVLVTMACAVPMGFFYALVNAPAQTVIHERAPAEMRGRFFGTQMLLANCVSLVLLLVIGAAADLLGVTAVLALYAPLVLAVAVWGIIVARAERRDLTVPPPSR